MTRVTPCLAHLSISRSSAGVARRSAGVASNMGLWRSGIRRSCSCVISPRGCTSPGFFFGDLYLSFCLSRSVRLGQPTGSNKAKAAICILSGVICAATPFVMPLSLSQRKPSEVISFALRAAMVPQCRIWHVRYARTTRAPAPPTPTPTPTRPRSLTPAPSLARPCPRTARPRPRPRHRHRDTTRTSADASVARLAGFSLISLLLLLVDHLS